jgi:hypothetical protein
VPCGWLGPDKLRYVALTKPRRTGLQTCIHGCCSGLEWGKRPQYQGFGGGRAWSAAMGLVEIILQLIIAILNLVFFFV